MIELILSSSSLPPANSLTPANADSLNTTFSEPCVGSLGVPLVDCTSVGPPRPLPLFATPLPTGFGALMPTAPLTTTIPLPLPAVWPAASPGIDDDKLEGVVSSHVGNSSKRKLGKSHSEA